MPPPRDRIPSSGFTPTPDSASGNEIPWSPRAVHRGALGVAITFYLLLVAWSPTAVAAPLPPDSAPPVARSAPPARSAQHSRPSWWSWSYLIDWGGVLLVSGAGAAVSFVKPHERSFSLSTPRIDHAMRKETVPSGWLALTAALPMATIALAQLAGASGHDVHHAYLGLGEALGLTMLITSTLKVSVGRLRPDFLDRCQPDADLRCTGDPDEVRTGRRSFPSGHASLSFAGASFLSLYLWGKLAPHKRLHWLWKAPLLLLPIAAATFVAWSRVRDRRHHWEDVLGGGLIGAGSAVLGYFLNYHPPWSQRAGQPRRRGSYGLTPMATRDGGGLVLTGSY